MHRQVYAQNNFAHFSLHTAHIYYRRHKVFPATVTDVSGNQKCCRPRSTQHSSSQHATWYSHKTFIHPARLVAARRRSQTSFGIQGVTFPPPRLTYKTGARFLCKILHFCHKGCSLDALIHQLQSPWLSSVYRSPEWACLWCGRPSTRTTAW